MIGKDTHTGRSSNSENYYFQLSPIKLHLKGQAPPQNCSFRPVIYKGLKLFDQTKECVPAVFNSQGFLQFEATFLNFLVLAYQPSKNVNYTLKILMIDGKRQEQVGTIEIDTSQYVQKHKANNKCCQFQEYSKLGSNYLLDYEIYVEKSRFNLEKFVKQIRGLQLSRTKERDTRSETGSRRISSKTEDTRSEIRQFQQQNTPVKKNITPIMSKNQPPSASISRATPQKPRYTRQQQSHQKRSLKIKKPQQENNIQQQQQQQQQKPKDVRQRVAQLQKQNSQQYSLHAAKVNQIKKQHVMAKPLKSSRLKKEVQAQKARQQQKIVAQPINWKNIGIKILFFLISFFLVYHAMAPSKKYNSKKNAK